MTKYVIGEAGWVDITPGLAYQVFKYPDGLEYIIDDAGDIRDCIFDGWPIHQTGKSDAELLAEIAARNPDWNLPEAPDRAESIMREWQSEWGFSELGQLTVSDDFGLFIARKLLKEGVIK